MSFIVGLIKFIIGFGRDVRAFGLMNAIKISLVGRGTGRLQLILPDVGPIIVRRGDSDFATVRQIFQSREYAVSNRQIEERMACRYKALLAAGQVPVIIDAGANIGMASLWFRSLYPDAVIVAVEPDHANAEILRQNVVAHRNVKVVEAAIGSEAGFAMLNNSGLSWAVQTERADRGCPIVTIDELVGSIDRGVPFIVKVDIEGFENDLFSKNLGWLNDAFAVFIELHDWMLPGQFTSRSVQKAMAAEEFEVLLRGENLIYVRV
jgi:FkbM family methyltransferase